MKKICIVIMLSVGLAIAPTQKSHAIVWVVVKAALKKVIKAIDLQVQRLQNKTIGLQNAQKALENKLSQLKLDEISGWVKKQKELYQNYYDELWKVKSAIAYYKRIRDIIEAQKDLVEEYKHAYALTRQDKNFTPEELNYIYTVYSGIIGESIKNVDQILLIINSFSLQMSDADRLAFLNHCADDLEKQVSDLRAFTSQNIRLSMQRAKDQHEVETIKSLYGL